jgi:hypothetical protein
MDRPDGSGGSSPTVVTSRSAGDGLTDDQDTRTSDIMAPPWQQPRNLTPVKSDTANSAPGGAASPDDAVSDGTAGRGVSPNGAPADGKDDAPAAGVTVVDGAPALPADTIASPRSAKSRAADPASADFSAASGSPVLSFGPPSHVQAQAVEDPTIAYPAEAAVRPPAAGPAPGGVTPDPASGGAPSFGTVPQAGSRPAPADPPLSPAAFAWEMPDPPPSSPSSPARTFLRSGTTRDSAAPKAEPAAGPATAAIGQGAAARAPSPSAGPATAGGPAQQTTGPKGPAHSIGQKGPALRGTAQKAHKGRQKRTAARQAHLTIARVEPWSVMKFSFVVSLVAFVILFVAVSVLYGALAGLGVFDSLQRVVSSLTSSQGSAGVNAKAWFSASRVLGYTALLGSLNIVLITAMSTIGSVVYNLTARLVGGVEVTLRETE